MTNRLFFKSCLENELAATAAIIQALPADKLDYRPHPHSRSAYEIAEHIIAHAFDFSVILSEESCDECLVMPFSNPEEGVRFLTNYWEIAIQLTDAISEEDFEKFPVELKVGGNPLLTLPRNSMLWFFLFDVVHHRGQLSTYLRPMGGKNPAVYGYSYDSNLN